MKASAIMIAIALLMACLACGVFDLVMLARGRPEETVSAVMQEWSRTFPTLPFALGMLAGHLFWH